MAVTTEEGVVAATPSRLPMLRALTLRDYRLLWVGQGISLIGDQFYYIALSWLTLQLTNSALALGGVLTAAAVPRGVLMLFGGAISDRLSPRLLMLGSDLFRGVVVAAQAILVLAGVAQLWQLYVLAVIFGAVDAIFYPAGGAMVPMMVPEELRPSAAALDQITGRGSIFIGPAIAGLLIASVGRTTGDGVAFAVDAVSFACSAVSLVLIRAGMRAPSSRGESDATAPGEAPGDDGILGSIVAGLRYAWTDPVLRALLVIIAGIDVTANGVFGVGLPLLARHHFTGGVAALGAMDAAFGAGALIGIAIAGSIAQPRKKGLVVIGVTTGFGLASLLMPFLPNLPAALVVMVLASIGSGLINVMLIPWLQNRTDPAMFGRVMSIVMLASIGLTPLSYAVAGWVATANLYALFVGGGALILATAIFAGASRDVRSID
ncbi:MAG TPA: MFS transporter [Chloroflexota bacterium]|nr:MFS transporter [Chloroflexota bacterium]